MGRLQYFLRNVFSFNTLIAAVILTAALWILVNASSGQNGELADGFLSGLAGILSVVSGFIGAFYFFAASRGNEFLSKIQTTNAFNELLWLTRHGLVATVVGTMICFAASLFEWVVHPDPRNSDIVVVLSVILTAYGVGTIWRCASIFNTLVKTR